MFCGRCGSELHGGDKFCRYCGADIPADSQKAVAGVPAAAKAPAAPRPSQTGPTWHQSGNVRYTVQPVDARQAPAAAASRFSWLRVFVAVAVVMALFAAAFFATDGKLFGLNPSGTQALPWGQSAASPMPTTYQGIYDEYAAKMREEAPKLADEYRAESASMTDLQQKANLSNEKVAKLAVVNTQGAERMAALMREKHDPYATYEEWALKLSDVYQEESLKITSAYMGNAV